jgi:hypothetical protein
MWFQGTEDQFFRTMILQDFHDSLILNNHVHHVNQENQGSDFPVNHVQEKQGSDFILIM